MVGFGRRHLGDHFTHHGSCARLFGLGCFHASQRHQSWAEGTCGVDGAAIDGNQKTVGHEDGQANGDARLAAVHGTLGIAGGLEHHEDQQGGTHGFANQSVPPVPLGTQTVGAQDACHVQLWREDGHQNRRAADGAQHLTTEVQDALQHITVPSEDQSQGHGAIQLAPAVVPHRVGQGGDRQAKDQGHHENPTRDHGGRLSCGVVLGPTATSRTA
eukprot:Skav208725  [mRNA]  locus=scaffold615:113783:115681:- [translate_table: standard]